MTPRASQLRKPVGPWGPPAKGVLQRKCACGTHTPGGGSCEGCANKAKGLQRKLGLGSVSDPLELEADRAADQVLGRSGSIGINRSPPAIQRAPSVSAGDQSHVPESVDRVIAGSGRPLDVPIRHEMEQGFGHDFSQVRVHHDNAAEKSANDVEARAYTVGSDIVFGQGQFAPQTGEGRRLLAHELAHVVQQTGATTAGPRGGSSLLLQRTPAAPTTAAGAAAVPDLSRIRIDAIADFVASTLTAPRAINAHINDVTVAHMTWMLFDPSDQMMSGSFSTLPNRPNATSAPFTLEPSHFSGASFVPGKYILRCVGLGSNHQPVVFADRDFNVLSADLTTGTAVATPHGALTFTKYGKTDANPPAQPNYALDVELKFLPASSVVCSSVGFVQSMQTIDSSGNSQQNTVNSEQDARQTPLAWSADRVAGAPSPFYPTWRNATGAIVTDPGWGRFGSGGATRTPASLIDTPSWNRQNSAKFESCAICRTGANTGQVYGCATWGYTATAAGLVTMMPRSFRQMPSDQFHEAMAAWNSWQASRPAASRPEAAPALKSP